MALDIIYTEGFDNIGHKITRVLNKRIENLDDNSNQLLATTGGDGSAFGPSESYSLRTSNGASGAGNSIWHRWTVSGGESTIFLAAWYKIVNGKNEGFFFFEGPYVDGAEHVKVTANQSRTAWDITGAGVSLGSFTDTVPNGIWMHIEIKIVISATVGEVTLRRDGVQIGSFTSVDTLATNAGQAGVIHGFRLVSPTDGSTSDHSWIDDIVVQGAAGEFLGRHRIRTYLPNADGAETDWTRISGAANSEMVDDSPTDQATYNESATSGDRDRYGIVSPSFDGVAAAVIVKALVSQEDPGTSKVKLGIRSEGAVEDLSVGQTTRRLGFFHEMRHVIPLNPDDGQPWEATDLDGAELVIESA